MSRPSPHTFFLGLLLLVGFHFVSSGKARAQTNLEINAGIQFNFSPPSAGGLARGGAYIALADDATAAYTNPAGLVDILEPEVYVEARGWEYIHRFTDRGRFEGKPEEEGIDTEEGLVDGESHDLVAGAAFVSYVYPRKKWSLAAFRHEVANFKATFRTQGAFIERTRSRDLFGFPLDGVGRLAALKNHMRLRIVDYGISAAYLWRRNLSLGAGVSYYTFRQDSRTDRFRPGLFEAEIEFNPRDVINTQIQQGSDGALGGSLGFIWRSPDRRWSLGGVYRYGPSFGLLAVSEPGPRNLVEAFERLEQPAKFSVPDIYGLGFAYRPIPSVRLSLDYNRVEYSVLAKDLVNIFEVRSLPTADPELDEFKADDADEIHLGVELFLSEPKRPIIVRFGVWHDPDHSLRFEGENKSLRAVYRERGDEFHYAAGFGIGLGRSRVDVALDSSERVNTLSVSMVFRLRTFVSVGKSLSLAP